MILVDTSAWVDFFRGRGALAQRVSDLLDDDEVALCGPVIAEIRRGLRGVPERRRVLPLLDACHLLTQPDRLWEEAGDLGFYLGRRGVSVKTLDLLIATHALAHEVSVLTSDTDFRIMQRAGIPLTLAV